MIKYQLSKIGYTLLILMFYQHLSVKKTMFRWFNYIKNAFITGFSNW